MTIIFQAFATGVMTGMVFSFMKLPIPAPTAFAGIMGIVGIFAGYALVAYVRG
jgi:XapX domain-containing protein